MIKRELFGLGVSGFDMDLFWALAWRWGSLSWRRYIVTNVFPTLQMFVILDREWSTLYKFW